MEDKVLLKLREDYPHLFVNKEKPAGKPGRPKKNDSEDKEHYRRLRKIEGEEAREIYDEQIKERFLEEVGRIEAEGRVESRAKLERDLYMYYNKITQIKFGKAKLHPSAITLLKLHYNADYQYILLGIRDYKHSGNMQGGVKLNIYPPYVHKYKTWKVTKDQSQPNDSETDE